MYLAMTCYIKRLIYILKHGMHCCCVYVYNYAIHLMINDQRHACNRETESILRQNFMCLYFVNCMSKSLLFYFMLLQHM